MDLENYTTPEHCPKCEAANPRNEETCSQCGIIFQRHFQARKRQAARPVKKRERARHEPGLGELGQYSKFFLRFGKLLSAGGNLHHSLTGAAGSGAPGKLVRAAEPYLNQGHGLIKSLEMSGAKLPPYAWAHLEAGQVSGRLPQFLKDLANEMAERRKRILAQIFNWRMLWFFFMLFCAAFSLSITSSVGDVNESQINAGVNAVLVGIASGAVPRFIAWALFFAVACVGFGWFQIKTKPMLTRKFPGFEAMRLGLPFFSGILIEDALSRYLTILARMLDAGLPLPRSLDLAAQDIEYPQWRDKFGRIRDTVEQGGTLAAGFAKTPHIPSDLVAETRVGETTGGLPDGLERAGTWLKESVGRKRLALNVTFAAALFLFSVILTIIVAIKGMSSWMPLLDF